MSSNTSDNTLAAPLPQNMPQTAETAAAEKHTYSQILKSSALIGGSSVVNILTGIIRTKAMAVLLGPAGFGLMSVYGSIADLARSIAGMGVNSSGVRQIAEAVGTGDQVRTAVEGSKVRRFHARRDGVIPAVFAEFGVAADPEGSILAPRRRGMRFHGA